MEQIITQDIQEKPKKQFKDLLKIKINDKLKICLFLLIFAITNAVFGLLSPMGLGINLIFICITFAVITIIDGFFKHYDNNG